MKNAFLFLVLSVSINSFGQEITKAEFQQLMLKNKNTLLNIKVGDKVSTIITLEQDGCDVEVKDEQTVVFAPNKSDQYHVYVKNTVSSKKCEDANVAEEYIEIKIKNLTSLINETFLEGVSKVEATSTEGQYSLTSNQQTEGAEAAKLIFDLNKSLFQIFSPCSITPKPDLGPTGAMNCSIENGVEFDAAALNELPVYITVELGDGQDHAEPLASTYGEMMGLGQDNMFEFTFPIDEEDNKN